MCFIIIFKSSCQPNSKLKKEANGVIVKKAIEEAIKESVEKNIAGAEITPFLLRRINEITGGESSRSSKNENKRFYFFFLNNIYFLFLIRYCAYKK